MKKAYQPFEAEYSDSSVKIFNRRYFESLGDLEIEWSVEVNGGVVISGKIDDTDIPARSARSWRGFFACKPLPRLPVSCPYTF